MFRVYIFCRFYYKTKQGLFDPIQSSNPQNRLANFVSLWNEFMVSKINLGKNRYNDTYFMLKFFLLIIWQNEVKLSLTRPLGIYVVDSMIDMKIREFVILRLADKRNIICFWLGTYFSALFFQQHCKLRSINCNSNSMRVVPPYWCYCCV